MEAADKITRLESILRDKGPALAAFSGGVDSAFLLYYAALAHPEKTVALNVASPLMSPADLADLPLVLESLKAAGARFQFKSVAFDPLAEPALAANPPDRCYLCKSRLIALWRAEAERNGLRYIMEGSQQDDRSAHRPGRRALAEHGVLSPLAEAGFTKADIRAASRALGLYGSGRPSQACLASRLPYGEPLTAEMLARIAATEEELIRLGFAGARARVSGNLLRLELREEQLERLNAAPEAWPRFFKDVLAAVGPLGWGFITLDLRGYQSSCFDPLPINVVSP